MTEKEFLEKLFVSPGSIDFEETMAVIDRYYEFSPSGFTNGALINEAGQNNGSCKLFAFARLHGLDQQQTLSCFGRYYRQDVLQHPDSQDHQNIRNFMKTGWGGLHFDAAPLNRKA
jgi:hypothetical protein